MVSINNPFSLFTFLTYIRVTYWIINLCNIPDDLLLQVHRNSRRDYSDLLCYIRKQLRFVKKGLNFIRRDQKHDAWKTLWNINKSAPEGDLSVCFDSVCEFLFIKWVYEHDRYFWCICRSSGLNVNVAAYSRLTLMFTFCYIIMLAGVHGIFYQWWNAII